MSNDDSEMSMLHNNLFNCLIGLYYISFDIFQFYSYHVLEVNTKYIPDNKKRMTPWVKSQKKVQRLFKIPLIFFPFPNQNRGHWSSSKLVKKSLKAHSGSSWQVKNVLYSKTWEFFETGRLFYISRLSIESKTLIRCMEWRKKKVD